MSPIFEPLSLDHDQSSFCNLTDSVKNIDSETLPSHTGDPTEPITELPIDDMDVINQAHTTLQSRFREFLESVENPQSKVKLVDLGKSVVDRDTPELLAQTNSIKLQESESVSNDQISAAAKFSAKLGAHATESPSPVNPKLRGLEFALESQKRLISALQAELMEKTRTSQKEKNVGNQ